MIFTPRFSNFLLFTSLIIATSSSPAIWCSNSTSTNGTEKPCFFELPTHNPMRLRASGNSLVLPCHVAHSKSSTVEWWYQDLQKTINVKIYPSVAAIRPTAVRFLTSVKPQLETLNETDVSDVSVMLRHVNVDDSGIYQCLVRPWSSDQAHIIDDKPHEYNADLPTLSYHVEFTGARLCQSTASALPCFVGMRTSSPTMIDAYQSAFLQCVVQNHRGISRVYWVVGNESSNSLLITEHLSATKHQGDRLRRVFPQSTHDFSIELSVNRSISERAYSCVIKGAGDIETTLFTYVVHSLESGETTEQPTTMSKKNETIAGSTSEKQKPSSAKLVPHDALTSEQIKSLRQKPHSEHKELEAGDKNEEIDPNEFSRDEQTSTTTN